jgi:hypothetical protein
MSEADVYERLAKVEAEVRWIKGKLAERLGIHEGEGRIVACEKTSRSPEPNDDEYTQLPTARMGPDGRLGLVLTKRFIPRSGE